MEADVLAASSGFVEVCIENGKEYHHLDSSLWVCESVQREC